MSKGENIQIPKALFIAMREALRRATRDSRRDDRVLHDETRDLLVPADDALTDHLDSRGPIR